MPIKTIRDFMKHEAAGGVTLALAAVVALIMANSSWSVAYQEFLDARLSIGLDGIGVFEKPLLLWINDALMAIFFLLVGLEIKREAVEGELSSMRKAALPGIAALGGMIVPALVYYVLNLGHPERLVGWAIPAATDIAFAMGVLALLGQRVPSSLKIFLLALAVMDDLGAIVIIALFYTSSLSVGALSLAFLALAILIVLNLSGVKAITPYIIVGFFLWIFVFKSGVHATLAGVALAFTIPLHGKKGERSPLRTLEHALMRWVSFFILPVFAFANAGVDLSGMGRDMLTHSVTLGVGLGLVLGKQIGVILASVLAIKLKLGQMPAGANLRQFYGVVIVTGIGFTMSLFIGSLAFPSHVYDAQVRLGVLGGSLFSAIMGILVLLSVCPKAAKLRAQGKA